MEKKAVLVIGASGGCGIAGTQLYKAMGVSYIVGISLDHNTDFVMVLGATEMVCYTDQKELKSFFDSDRETFDCVYDATTGSGGGEDYLSMSLDLLKKDSPGACSGEYVALNGSAGNWIRAFTGTLKANQSMMLTKSNAADLKCIISLMDKIKERPNINIFPFSEEGLADAFKLLKSRRSKGKIVLNLS